MIKTVSGKRRSAKHSKMKYRKEVADDNVRLNLEKRKWKEKPESEFEIFPWNRYKLES